MSTQEVWCLLIFPDGTTIEPFPADVTPSGTVFNLKKEVKNICSNRLNGVDTPGLQIWRCTDSTISFRNVDAQEREARVRNARSNRKLDPLDAQEDIVDLSLAPKEIVLVQVPRTDPAAAPNKRAFMFEVGSAPTSPETTKRRRLERLSGSNTIFITVGEAGESNAPTLPSCGAGFEHLTTIPKLIAADKTRYIEELDKEPAYQYLFLRPRRFGKSTFLQTLSDYYDETKRDSFDNIFRDLYIGQHPTKSRNSLLVLCFNFSGTPVLDNFDDTKKYFHKQMHLTLLAFLNTNQAVLSPIEGLMVADDMGSLTLQGVLSLVKRRGKELFVGVDEYDAPGNSALFSSDPGLYERVAEFFSTQFYGVIKEAVSQLIVVKYWLTGVLPAFRDSIGPLLAAHIISNESEYHGLCGLTDAEVQTIARAYLSSDIEPPALAETMRELQRRYGGYRFCAPGDEPLETLYNPQLVFTHLRGLAKNKSDLDPRDEIEAVHTARPKYDSK